MDYLNYKGVNYPVRVSYYALKQFQAETGKGIETIDQDMSNLEVLLYHALVAGSKAENKELPLKREEMEFVLDELLAEFNKILMSSFPEAKVGSKKN